MNKITLGGIAISLIATGFASQIANAGEITVAAGNLPPHITKQGEGREAEIIRSSLEACGHTVKFVVQPFTRHWETYKTDENIDAVATVPIGLPLPGVASSHYISFHNGVSSLAAAKLKSKSLSDLSGKSVVAFAGAKGILPGLDTAISTFKSYTEKTDQIKQSRLLFSGRADAVLGDGLIFAEYNRTLQEQAKTKDLGFDPEQPVKFSAIMEATPYVMMFKDASVNDDFNRCYSELKSAGTIDAINNKYISKYKNVVGDEYNGL